MLQKFFIESCNGDWEHMDGIKIESLDNPGWSIAIQLPAALQNSVEFIPVELHRSEDDWVVCRMKTDRFEGFGGPKNLAEILDIFFGWAGYK